MNPCAVGKVGGNAASSYQREGIRANYNGRSSDKCPCISVHCPSIYSAGLTEWPDGKCPSSASEAGPSTKCDKPK